MAGSTPASLTADPGAAREGLAPQVSPALDAWRRFRRHRLAVFGAVVLIVMALAVVLGPSLWKVSINDIDFTARLETSTPTHPFGTDDLGQDLLARMLYGGRISLAVGLGAMMVAVFVGTLIGAVAGISRGSVDAALMLLTDLFLSLPQLPLLLLLIYLFGDALKGLAGPEGGGHPAHRVLLPVVQRARGEPAHPRAALLRRPALTGPTERTFRPAASAPAPPRYPPALLRYPRPPPRQRVNVPLGTLQRVLRYIHEGKAARVRR